MRIHRFYIENIDINDQGEIVTQETDLIHQLKNVFRYKIGQIIHIFNEKVGEIEVEISEIGKKDMSFKYIRNIKDVFVDKSQKRHISLYMSIIKNSNFDLVAEKAVELGVEEIIPVITERTVKSNLNIIRINKIIKEATEQSGRIDLMKIGDTLELNKAIQNAIVDFDMVYFGSVDENDSVKQDNKQFFGKIAVFIGPEGGYSDDEVVVFVENKITPLRLGDYVLRAETAAIVACGLVSL